MTSITLFPGRYIQGKDALSKLGGECARLGGNAFVIASPHPLNHLLPAVLPGITGACRAVVEPFGRQCSDEEIQRLLGLCREAGCDLVVGMGGGKTLDAAKAVAHLAAAPSIMVPTIASTDAPCSSVCVVYTNDGVFKRADILPRNPDSVIVDTGVIAQASPRFLAAGMGDALATWFEAESCRIRHAPNIAGAVGSMTAYALARLCRDTLFDYGPAALASCSARAVTPALERVVEANTLSSGFGFESAGLAAAHPSLMEQTYAFCQSVGLPSTLADLGLEEVSDRELLQVAEKACAPEESIHNEPGEVSPETVAEAIRAADAWGRKRRDASGLHR